MVYKAIYVYMGRPPCKIPLDTSPRIEMALNSLNLNLKATTRFITQKFSLDAQTLLIYSKKMQLTAPVDESRTDFLMLFTLFGGFDTLIFIVVLVHTGIAFQSCT